MIKTLKPLQTPVQAAFERLAPRERTLVLAAGSLLLLALLWWTALAPALQTYRNSANAHAKLDAQLAQMQQLAQEAKQLNAAPRMSAKDAQNWALQSTKQLGKSTVIVQGSAIQITLIGAEAAQLATWLAQARTQAGLLPTEAHWKRNASGLWDGSLTLAMAAESTP